MVLLITTLTIRLCMETTITGDIGWPKHMHAVCSLTPI